MELFSNSPFQCEKLLFVRMIPLFGLIHGMTSTSHWMVPTIILFLGENGSKAFPGGVCLQQERLLEIRESQHWSVHTLLLEDVESL